MRLPVPILNAGAGARGGLHGRHADATWSSGALGQAAWTMPAEPPARLQQRLVAALATQDALALGLSITLPFCAVRCLCCDRDVAAGQPPEVLDSYLQHLCQEIDRLATQVGGGRELLQLHLGGGSANLFSECDLVGLMQTVRRHWRLPGDAELSVQCDPRRVGWVQLELLRGLGFGEVQFGVLDLDPQVQRAIGRLHSAALIDDACSLARACGIGCVHLGLVVGLPEQTLASWRTTLQQVIAMAPGRISLARYRHQPWRASGQCAIDPQRLPDPALAQALTALAGDMLGAVGYRWLGAGLFVLEDDPLSLAADEGRLRASLVGHTGHAPMPLLGVGCGAVSDLAGCLLWNRTTAAAWQADLDQGRLPVALAWQADAQAQRRRAAAEHLLCQLELPAALLDGDLAPLYLALAQQAPPGSLVRLPDRLVLTSAGRPVLPLLCAQVAGLPVAAQPPLPAWLA